MRAVSVANACPKADLTARGNWRQKCEIGAKRLCTPTVHGGGCRTPQPGAILNSRGVEIAQWFCSDCGPFDPKCLASPASKLVRNRFSCNDHIGPGLFISSARLDPCLAPCCNFKLDACARCVWVSKSRSQRHNGRQSAVIFRNASAEFSAEGLLVDRDHLEAAVVVILRALNNAHFFKFFRQL